MQNQFRPRVRYGRDRDPVVFCFRHPFRYPPPHELDQGVAVAIFRYSQFILAGELQVLEVVEASMAKLFKGAVGVARKAGDQEW
jgi:hypothetical protein